MPDPNTATATTPSGADSSVPPTGSDPAKPDQPRDDKGRFTEMAKDYRLTNDDVQQLGLPSWAIGRSPAEGFQMANQLYGQMLNTGGNTPQRPQAQQSQQPNPYQQQQAYQPPQAQPAGPQPPSADEWVENPAEAYRKQSEYERATTFQPALQGLWQSNAAMARDLVARDEADAFKRWGPEIDTMLSQVSPEARTVQNIRTIVKMVKADHMDDLMNERVDRELQKRIESGALSRPGGTAGTSVNAPNSLDFSVDDLPPERREMLEATGVVRNGQLQPAFWEFMGNIAKSEQKSVQQAAQEWWASAKKSDVIFASVVGEDRGGNPVVKGRSVE